MTNSTTANLATTNTTDSKSAAPTVKEYLNASNAAYTKAFNGAPAAPTGFTTIDYQAYRSGTQAAAFRNKDTGQIIIAYEGTNLNNCSFANSAQNDFCHEQLKTNVAIATGQTEIQANKDALAFAQRVSKQNPDDPIYVTGHSLGGEEAQYVTANASKASITIAGGASFGSPGVPGVDRTAGAAYDNFVNYADYIDPVANFVPGNGSHVGSVVYVGEDSLSAPDLIKGKLESGIDKHQLSNYAKELGADLETNGNQAKKGSADLAIFANAVGSDGLTPFGGKSTVDLASADIQVKEDSITVGNNTLNVDADGNVTVQVNTTGENASALAIDQQIRSNGASQYKEITTTDEDGILNIEVNGVGKITDADNANIQVDDGSSATIKGNNNKITTGTGSTISAIGDANTITLGENSTLTFDGINQTINANKDTINSSTDDTAAINGNNNTIISGDKNTLNITGTGNATSASNSTVNIIGDNTGNVVSGEGNTGTNWGAGSVAPIDPPVEPIKPEDPPVEPIKPEDPPVIPVDPPVIPVDPPPVDPVTPPPVDPVTPADPVIPADPVVPDPTTPSNPIGPETPTDPIDLITTPPVDPLIPDPVEPDPVVPDPVVPPPVIPDPVVPDYSGGGGGGDFGATYVGASASSKPSYEVSTREASGSLSVDLLIQAMSQVTPPQSAGQTLLLSTRPQTAPAPLSASH